MIRNFKALGLAAFALLAMGAMFVSSASAQVFLTSGKTPGTHTKTKVHAIQYGEKTQNDFLLPGLSQRLTCDNANVSFSGETAATGTSTQLTITPIYKDCYTLNADHTEGLPVTVSMNGCDYLFKNLETWIGTTTWTSAVDLVCPKEKQVVIDTYFFGTKTAHSVTACGVTIAPQTIAGKIQYHNIAGTPDDITVTVNNKVKVKRTGACGVAEEEATYTSNLTLTSSEGHDLWFSHKV